MSDHGPDSGNDRGGTGLTVSGTAMMVVVKVTVVTLMLLKASQARTFSAACLLEQLSRLEVSLQPQPTRFPEGFFGPKP